MSKGVVRAEAAAPASAPAQPTLDGQEVAARVRDAATDDEAWAALGTALDGAVLGRLEETVRSAAAAVVDLAGEIRQAVARTRPTYDALWKARRAVGQLGDEPIPDGWWRRLDELRNWREGAHVGLRELHLRYFDAHVAYRRAVRALAQAKGQPTRTPDDDLDRAMSVVLAEVNPPRDWWDHAADAPIPDAPPDAIDRALAELEAARSEDEHEAACRSVVAAAVGQKWNRSEAWEQGR